MTPDPKPLKPYRASKKEWEEMRLMLLPRDTKCFCGCGRFADSLHHLVGRDQGGDDRPSNLVPLAGSGTTLCHGAIQYGQRTYDAARRCYVEPGVVAAGIGRHLTTVQRRYVTQKKGEWWLEKIYPEEA